MDGEAKARKRMLRKASSEGADGKSKAQKIALWIVCFIFTIYAISLLIPFLWLLMNSFKSRAEFSADAVSGNGGLSFPSVFDFQNYYEALIGFRVQVGAGDNIRNVNLLGMFLYSVIVTVTTTFLEVFFSAATAYVLAKYEFPGKKIIFSMVLISMVVPIVGSLPVMYRFMGTIGLRDTLPGLWFIYVSGFGFGFLLLNAHFKGIPWTYAEAAQLDGATHFGIFFRIMLPMSRPQLVSLAIITAIGYWNDYATPKIYLPSMPTVAVGLNSLTIEIQKTADYPLMFACMLVAIIPILAVFACFQKVIISSVVAGGIKG